MNFIAPNAELARPWEPIVRKRAALSDADKWAKVKGKPDHLER
ncbi:MAG: DUF3470 domain-containing protein [Proteobacteria bacterium]|nr:DUF3470 domain-containing protein [Pseudomonadota bacterium]